ncbi:RNA polymerase sigma factor [Paracoccus solventivorans]|nr:RNA polymerase sigma factor [Paracoccus solventivorans]
MRDIRSEMEEQALLARVRAGDAAAFEALVAAHYRYVFRIAYRWLGHESDAEDVTQTVCMRLPQAIRSFDGRAAFTSWLYKVTLNAVRDLQRSQQRRTRLADAVAVVAEDSHPPGQEEALRVADIWRAVRALPDKQRDAVMLVHAEGLSQAEAAQIMGCKEVTVAWHIHKARKTLRGVL